MNRRKLLRLFADSESLSLQQCRQLLGLSAADLGRLRSVLKTLVASQQLTFQKGRYSRPKSGREMGGRIMMTRQGAGFLVTDTAAEEDIYLPRSQLRGVLHGDRVLVRCVRYRNRVQGQLLRLLERAQSSYIGLLEKQGKRYWITVSGGRQRLPVNAAHLATAAPGQLIEAKLLDAQLGTLPNTPLEAAVTRVLGAADNPSVVLDSVALEYRLRQCWPASLSAVKATEVTAAEYRNREDLRALPLVTIDGEDAQDFDDALYCEEHADGFQLLVAIADVAHYVVPGSDLDEEAQQRVVSVYFPDKVLPMLPEALSNGCCSLQAEQDRLCVFCRLQLDRDGHIKQARFGRAVMRSQARLSYQEVSDHLATKEAHTGILSAAIQQSLKHLKNLYQKREKIRQKRGAIGLELHSYIVSCDAQRVHNISRQQRTIAHKIVEECMILANIAAADMLARHHRPALYRVHPAPEEQKSLALQEFLTRYGLPLSADKEMPTAAVYSRILELVQQREDADVLQRAVLNALPRACYQAQNAGHFGLALQRYSHFTSPIRRYPDLLVHRALIALQAGQPSPWTEEALVTLGEHCSSVERNADEAMRQASKRLKCLYLASLAPRTVMTGVAVALSGKGLLLNLSEFGLDGLLPLRQLPRDDYHLDADRRLLQGRRHHYHLGMRLKLRISRIRADIGMVDLALA